MEYEVSEHAVRERHSPAAAEGPSAHYAEDVAARMRFEVTHLDEDEVEFDLSGVDVSFANALRRIMLAEVPTMAIERVFIEENDGVVQDEVLAHRLGLVPIAADPRDFEELHDPEDATDANTVVFGLEVRAPPNERASRVPSARVAQRVPGQPVPHQDDDDADDYAPGGPKHTTKVFSGDLSWLPQGEQEAFLRDRPVKPVHDDILLAKLRPGQNLSLEAHGCKGIGKDHAKFSPVATASYRMKAVVHVDDDAAPAPPYAGAPSPSIFDATAAADCAAAARPRPCVLCKQCVPLRTAPPHARAFADRVALRRKGDHFLFKVETAGQLAPLRIVRDAIAVLKGKCDHWRRELELSGGQLSSDAPGASTGDAAGY